MSGNYDFLVGGGAFRPFPLLNIPGVYHDHKYAKTFDVINFFKLFLVHSKKRRKSNENTYSHAENSGFSEGKYC